MQLSEYYLFRMSPQIVPDYWDKWPDYRLQYLFDLKYPTSLRLHVLYEARALSLPQSEVMRLKHHGHRSTSFPI